MDFPYLEKVTKLNVAALAAIASAPPPPEPKVEGAVSADTTVTWPTVPGSTYRLRWRRTDSANWEHVVEVVRGNSESAPANCSEMRTKLAPSVEFDCTLRHIRVDDWVFGVSSVSKDGFESPVASAVPGGAFKPFVAPPPAQP
jgi:hypothetical protein